MAVHDKVESVVGALGVTEAVVTAHDEVECVVAALDEVEATHDTVFLLPATA